MLWVVFGLYAEPAVPSDTQPSFEAVVARYLATRDFAALERELAALPRGQVANLTWLPDLLRVAEPPCPGTGLAVAPDPSAAGPLASALDALAEAARGPTEGELGALEKRLGAVQPRIVAHWLGALVLARRGDLGGAVGRVSAPPEPAGAADRLALALLGKVLPVEDRWMLGAVVRDALVRAAERGRMSALDPLLEGLAAFDVGRMGSAVLPLVRAWRRQGDDARARRLLEHYASLESREALESNLPTDVASLPCAGGSDVGAAAGPTTTELGLEIERALLGLPARPARDALASSPSRRLARTGLALLPARLRQVPSVPGPFAGDAAPSEAEPFGRATGLARVEMLLAYMARLAGRAATARDVADAARRAGRDAAFPDFAGTWLASLDMAVLRLAGAGLEREPALRERPFLFLLPRRDSAGYDDRAHLVVRLDAERGLLWLAEPDLEAVDVLPIEVLPAGRVLVAVAREEASRLAAGRAGPAGRAGERVEAALGLAARGSRSEAFALLAGDDGAHRAARAWLHYLEALQVPSAAAWRTAHEALGDAPPADLGFFAFLGAQAAGARRDASAALEHLERLVQAEGRSAAVDWLLHGALAAAGRAAEAGAALDAAAIADPLDARTWLYRGSWVDAPPERGERDLRRAFAARPGDPRMGVALAVFLARSARRDEALAVLRAASRHIPDEQGQRLLDAARRQVEVQVIEEAATDSELAGFERSADPATRRRAAFRLASMEQLGAEERLRTLLLDPSAEVRATVLGLYMRPWLRRRGSQDEVLGRRIVSLLENDEDATVRSAAARLLGYLPDDFAVRALATRLASPRADPLASVRTVVALALAGQASPLASRALVAGLADVDVGVRRAAIDALFERTAGRLGFEPDGEPTERLAALRRWRAWLAGTAPPGAR